MEVRLFLSVGGRNYSGFGSSFGSDWSASEASNFPWSSATEASAVSARDVISANCSFNFSISTLRDSTSAVSGPKRYHNYLSKLLEILFYLVQALFSCN